MTRLLPTDSVELEEGEDADWIQYRGRETTAAVDQFGLVFTCSRKEAWNTVVHDPLPVVDDDAEDPPPNAVPRSVADALVERSPLVGYGVVCEYPTGEGHGHRPDLDIDGKVMASPEAVSGRANNLTQPDEDDDGADDGETDEDSGGDQ